MRLAGLGDSDRSDGSEPSSVDVRERSLSSDLRTMVLVLVVVSSVVRSRGLIVKKKGCLG